MDRDYENKEYTQMPGPIPMKFPYGPELSKLDDIIHQIAKEIKANENHVDHTKERLKDLNRLKHLYENSKDVGEFLELKASLNY